MMDPDSPFANQHTTYHVYNGYRVHVNFCDACHHVWKAPAAAERCVNCNNAPTKPRSLVDYKSDVPIS